MTSSNLHGEDPVAREAANEVNGYPWEVDDVEQSCCPRSSQVVSVEYLEELVNSCKVTKVPIIQHQSVSSALSFLFVSF